MDAAKNGIAKDYNPLNGDVFKVSYTKRKGHGKLYKSNYIEKNKKMN